MMNIFNRFKRKKGKVIIGIHGLDNKPSEKLLRRWWKQSIRDGLHQLGRDNLFFRFEMAYWADLLHPKPLSSRIRKKDSVLFLSEPYVPLKKKDDKVPIANTWRKKLLSLFEIILDNLYFSRKFAGRLMDWSGRLIKKRFSDLYVYFSDAHIVEGDKIILTRRAIQKRLLVLLRKYNHYDILLIGHSMGSIIAYDVLNMKKNNVRVHTLVTIGSPLGLPLIMERIAEVHNFHLDEQHRLNVPESIEKNWFNIADLRDKVTINYTLADDFVPNSKGVKIIDITVENKYEIDGRKNPHKAYGYLQTEKMAEIVADFLEESGKNTKKKRSWINFWQKKDKSAQK